VHLGALGNVFESYKKVLEKSWKIASDKGYEPWYRIPYTWKFWQKLPNTLVKKHPRYRIPKTPGRAWVFQASVRPSHSRLGIFFFFCEIQSFFGTWKWTWKSLLCMSLHSYPKPLWARLLKGWIGLIAIQRININRTKHTIHWIGIYPVDRVISL